MKHLKMERLPVSYEKYKHQAVDWYARKLKASVNGYTFAEPLPTTQVSSTFIKADE
jgi:hypothetical protein